MVAEIRSYDATDGTTISYIGSHGWATSYQDIPAHRAIEGRLRQTRLITQSVPVQPWGFYGGALARDLGQLDLMNADGGLDALSERAVDGRRVAIKVGLVVDVGELFPQITDWALVDEDDAILLDESDAFLLDESTVQDARAVRRQLPAYNRMYDGLVANADSWEFAGTDLRLTLQDAAADLRKPIQSARYLGTGDAEGGEDLKDRTQPLAFGRCYQAEPVMVDPAQLILQVSSLPIEAIDAVYDRGVALVAGAPVTSSVYADLVAASVTAGQYRVARELGMVKLGSPPETPVTCDLRGIRLDTRYGPQEPWSDGTYFTDGTGWSAAIDGPGYVETVADLVDTILVVSAKWTLDRIDDASVADLRSAVPHPAGIYIPSGTSPTVEQVIHEITAGVGIAAGPDRLGRYRLVLLAAPLLGAAATYDMRSIISIERLSLPWRVTPRSLSMGYQRYARQLGPAEVATGVSDERRDQLGKEWRVASLDVADEVVTRHPTSKASVLIPSPMATRTGADAALERLRTLYAPGVKMIRIGVKQLFDVELGTTIKVVHDRYGLSTGRNMVVVSQSIDMGRGRTSLVCLG